MTEFVVWYTCLGAIPWFILMWYEVMACRSFGTVWWGMAIFHALTWWLSGIGLFAYYLHLGIGRIVLGARNKVENWLEG